LAKVSDIKSALRSGARSADAPGTPPGGLPPDNGEEFLIRSINDVVRANRLDCINELVFLINAVGTPPREKLEALKFLIPYVYGVPPTKAPRYGSEEADDNANDIASAREKLLRGLLR